MNEDWSGGAEPAGRELSRDCGGVCVRDSGWGLVFCFGKKALSFLEVVCSGKEDRLNRASCRLSVKISSLSTFTRNEKQLNMLLGFEV